MCVYNPRALHREFVLQCVCVCVCVNEFVLQLKCDIESFDSGRKLCPLPVFTTDISLISISTMTGFAVLLSGCLISAFSLSMATAYMDPQAPLFRIDKSVLHGTQVDTVS